MEANVRLRLHSALWAFALLFLSSPGWAQFCADGGGGITNGWLPLGSGPNQSLNCLGFLYCYNPDPSGPSITLEPAGCDPSAGTCGVRATTPVEFPGNHQNPLPPPGSRGWVTLDWTDSGGGFAGSCGLPGANILDSLGDAHIQVGGFSCTDFPNGDVFNLKAQACVTACPKTVNQAIDLTLPALQQLFCDTPEPPKDSCNDCFCRLGAGPGGGGTRGLSPEDIGPNWLSPTYSSGGAGHPGLPGTPAWNTSLGRYWSHAYAQRIVQDPNESHVWLLDDSAVFREFGDLSGGAYQTNSPSDEYRTLHWLGAGTGWELRTPDGSVTVFDAGGLWTSTVDRNGSTISGSYAAGQLSEVDFPDGRRLDFTYHGSGRLASITEVGTDGTTTRTWGYQWSEANQGLDLVRADRPDTTAWELLYDNPLLPGYLTRLTLIGTDGSERIEGGWTYDAQGNVIETWKGAPDFNDPAAVEKYAYGYDVPAQPTQTTVTDPVGSVTTFLVDRDPDPTSNVARVLSVNGECPTCGFGPETQFFYDDASNPLRPTRTVDGRGTETHFTYGALGQLGSKIEAVGTTVERTTTWEYGDASFATFPTAVVVESVTGTPAERRTDLIYDAAGNLTVSTASGMEAGNSFSLDTDRTYNFAGKVLTVDPPGFGATDVTSYTYDATGHVRLTRTDPLVGTTAFGHDPLLRRTDVTDVNQITTVTTYDELDRILTVTAGVGPASLGGRKGKGAGPTQTTTHIYDVFGDLFQTSLPRLNVIENLYDGAGRLESVERKPDASTRGERTLFTLDGASNRTRKEQQSWDGANWQTRRDTEFVYSSACRLERVVQAPGAPEESVTEYAYDCNGNLERIWDANHPSNNQTNPTTQLYAYDELDRQTSLTQPWAGGGSSVTLYGYDNQNHLTSVTDAEGNTTAYVYSDRDLRTLETSPVSGSKSATYNEHGRLLTKTDARGITVTRTVDAADRLTNVTYPDTTLDETYTYGSSPGSFNVGRLTGITRHGETVAYAYDRFGRTLQDGDLTLEYDENGNLTRLDYPTTLGVEAIYTHDFADRPATMQIRTSQGGPLTDLITAAAYLPGGPLTSLSLAGGDSEVREFDARYVPTRIFVPGKLDWSYSTDGLGNLLAVVDAVDPSNNRAFAHQDIDYFLTQAAGPWGSLSWTYDKIGNRLAETRDGLTNDYLYPSNGSGNLPQLEQVLLTGGGSLDFSYDAVGNLVDRFHNVPGQVWTTTLGYDDSGRLDEANETDLRYDGRGFLLDSVWPVLLKGPGGNPFPTAEPSYGSDGILYHSSRSGSFPGGAQCEMEGDVFFFYFGDRLVASWYQSICENLELPSHIVTNHLGTPILTFNTVGTPIWDGGFEPFGTDYAAAQGSASLLRLPGQWSDFTWTGAGLPFYYNVHRWYDPETGLYNRVEPRGLMPDQGSQVFRSLPISTPRGPVDLPNPHYAYADQLPLAKTDPTGADAFDWFPLHCLWSPIACNNTFTDCKERWSCRFAEASDEELTKYLQMAQANSPTGFFFKVCLNEVPSCIKAQRCPWALTKFPRPVPSAPPPILLPRG